jgi:predicted TPR repeat methyltransferase
VEKRKQIQKKLRSATSTAELMDAYREWADTYDRDLLDAMGYVAPALAGEALERYLEDRRKTVLDVGCGTGIVGEILHGRGYRKLDGLDYSRDMLRKAAEKGVYRELLQADLRKAIDIPTNRYDAIISVGTFTIGHVGPDAFRELIRITKPDGVICATVRMEAWISERFRDVMAAMENEGLWQLEELRSTPYIREDESSCKLCLYRILGLTVE